MHSKAKTYSEVTVLQVVGKSYNSVSGRLKGLSMNIMLLQLGRVEKGQI